MVCWSTAHGVSSPSAETANTSALRTNNLRPADSTSPRATSFSPRAVGYGPGDRAVEVALLLSEPIAVGHLDHASALAHLGHSRPQEAHDARPGEAFRHPLEHAGPRSPPAIRTSPYGARKTRIMRHPSEGGIPWASMLASVGRCAVFREFLFQRLSGK